MNEWQKVIENLGSPRILVVGDLILDRYTWGDAERVSPEAPVPVLLADKQEVRLGGAASVAGLLRGLDAEVIVAGVCGDDADGRVLMHELSEVGLAESVILVDPNRPTTVKERFMGRAAGKHPQQMLRVDRESRQPLRLELEARLIPRLIEQVSTVQAVLVSDYGMGVCTPDVLNTLRISASGKDIPLFVDPARRADCSRYSGVDLLKPNRVQAELATGQKIVTPEDGLRAGQALCRTLAINAVLVTLDRDGMVLTTAEGVGQWFPTRARAVYDITGAGDMVLAMLGLCRACGLSLETAAQLANVAAGLEVECLGVTNVTRTQVAEAAREKAQSTSEKVVSLHRLPTLAEHYHWQGKQIVLTNGCFDLLHAGHIACLEEASRMGDVLMVAVNSDSSVRRLKGSRRPVIAQDDRARMLAALQCVTHVVIFEDDTPIALIQQIEPDVLVKGGSTEEEMIVGRELVESYGGRVCRTSRVAGLSTTSLLSKIGNGETPYETSSE